jgi:eukaryotic-like serine/threonine-protein kinase
MSGQILRGHYQIVRALSSGGFGQTFLAQDTDIPGNPVCVVKQLKPLSQTPAHLEIARQLFEREAQKLTLLGNHDQIPRLLAYFKENNEFYLVQEYIEGHTLDVELPLGQRWTEAQVVDLLQQMLTVLVYVHDEGVIHRDIKPPNIIRRQHNNKLVLIDFGAVKEVAQGVPGQPVTLVTGTQIGTVGYMPTEQGRGKPKPSSDLYALGMIGIQALTGRYPHQLEEDPNTGETVWQNLTQVSPGLAQVLTQMTRYHFKDRYQRAVEALQAVRKLAPTSGTTPSEQRPTVPATQMAMETVQELMLEWTEQGQTRTKIIRPQQPTKFPGRVRIGRDPAQCDIVLSNPTVSALHIEIVFDSQRFLVRNLRENNPLYVNGQPLSQGEAALHQGSVLRLGEAEVRVTSITQRQYPVGSVPSGSFSTSQPSSPQPVAPTVPAGRSSGSYRMNVDESANNVSGKGSSSGSTPVNPPKPPGKKNRFWYGLFPVLIVVGFIFYPAIERSLHSQNSSSQTSSPSSLSSSSTNSSSSSSSSSTSVSTPKAQCGDASIDTKYPFYRVFIDNAGSDVQGMLMDIRTRFCGDAQIAERGIKIAAFQNRERADEFVRSMKQYYPNTVSVEITPY